MDAGLMETLRSIEEVRRVAYDAGHKAGYAKGLIDGRIEGLNRNQEIVHELIGDKNDDRKTD